MKRIGPDNAADASRGIPAITPKALSAVAFLAFPMAILAHKGLAPLLVLAALAILVDAVVKRTLSWRFGMFSLSFVALMAFSAVSAGWSIAPADTLTTIPAVVAIGFGGVLMAVAARDLSEASRMQVRRALIVGGIVGFAILSIEISTGGLVMRTAREAVGLTPPRAHNAMLIFNSALSVGAIFLWPWIVALARAFSFRWAVAGVLAAGAALVFAESDAPLLAAVAGFAWFALTLTVRRGFAVALGVLVVAGTMAAPIIAVQLPNPLVSIKNIEFLSHSAQHRLVIWRTTVDHIEKKPVFGHGFDTARALYSGADAVLLRFAPDEPEKTWVNHYAPIPLHPHNGVLQVWLELGGVGAAILCAVLVSIMLAIERNVANRLDRAMSYGAFGSAMFVGLVSFGAWQNWWLCGLFICGALLAAAVATRAPRPSKSDRAGGGDG
jgi:O-antigen ligase